MQFSKQKRKKKEKINKEEMQLVNASYKHGRY